MDGCRFVCIVRSLREHTATGAEARRPSLNSSTSGKVVKLDPLVCNASQPLRSVWL